MTRLAERVLIVVLLSAAVIFMLREARAAKPLMGAQEVSLELQVIKDHGGDGPSFPVADDAG